MKHILLMAVLAMAGISAQSQGLKGLINKAKQAVSGTTAADAAGSDIAEGLKAALTQGAEKGTAVLSKPDGFFANAALKILMPPEAQKIETTLRRVGMGRQVDEAVLSMNRAAEEACKSAAPIFINAIRQMSFQDAVSILRGPDTAATGYLRNKTTVELTNAFRPVIEQSLQKVDATKYWNGLISGYNKFTLQKINPDLVAYVTERALNGIFLQIADEEKNIRQNPMARTSDILRKVFAK
ncbi:MAG: DUF4197 domain-containing protein [Chitinophagaceae bacterium]|nr:DUF4197 domain-containing protein [Chitinophagaceae bacterium]